MPFTVGLCLTIPRGHHALAQGFTPALNLFAVEVGFPVDVQRFTGLVERLLGRFPANAFGGVGREIGLSRHRPITVLRGKKSRHRCGIGSVVFRSPPVRRG